MLKPEKECTRCNLVKLLEDYYRDSAHKDGRQSGCKACAKAGHQAAGIAYYKANSDKVKARTSKWKEGNPIKRKANDAKYREAHPAKIIASSARYRRDNPEKIADAQAKYYKENPEKVSAHSAKWQKENPKKVAGYQAKWTKANKGKVNAKVARRSASKLQRTPIWSEKEAIKDVYLEAGYFQMEVDHIIPLQGELVSGLHVWDNLQLLSKAENCSKSNKFNPDTFI